MASHSAAWAKARAASKIASEHPLFHAQRPTTTERIGPRAAGLRRRCAMAKRSRQVWRAEARGAPVPVEVEPDEAGVAGGVHLLVGDEAER